MLSGTPSGSPWPLQHCPCRHDGPMGDDEGYDYDAYDDDNYDDNGGDNDEVGHDGDNDDDDDVDDDGDDYDVYDCNDVDGEKDDMIITRTSVSPFLGLLQSSSRNDWTSLESSSWGRGRWPQMLCLSVQYVKIMFWADSILVFGPCCCPTEFIKALFNISMVCPKP